MGPVLARMGTKMNRVSMRLWSQDSIPWKQEGKARGNTANECRSEAHTDCFNAARTGSKSEPLPGYRAGSLGNQQPLGPAGKGRLFSGWDRQYVNIEQVKPALRLFQPLLRGARGFARPSPERPSGLSAPRPPHETKSEPIRQSAAGYCQDFGEQKREKQGLTEHRVPGTEVLQMGPPRPTGDFSAWSGAEDPCCHRPCHPSRARPVSWRPALWGTITGIQYETAPSAQFALLRF
jgi:hypothetical protein